MVPRVKEEITPSAGRSEIPQTGYDEIWESDDEGDVEELSELFKDGVRFCSSTTFSFLLEANTLFTFSSFLITNMELCCRMSFPLNFNLSSWT